MASAPSPSQLTERSASRDGASNRLQGISTRPLIIVVDCCLWEARNHCVERHKDPFLIVNFFPNNFDKWHCFILYNPFLSNISHSFSVFETSYIGPQARETPLKEKSSGDHLLLNISSRSEALAISLE
ncbi:hypothetical protein JTE90_006983 [Oedothorax gibbosus]|uniref:Uncharacterized protein n=1 Tax=Oedothorax gibbosus TaxID=931172 RepID=A0AAV6V948_9ARAC|nr:hypothetical protein JTE90_006983 [Oedothorax gibbosus]